MIEWYSASDLADLDLPGLPQRRQDIYAKAKREQWKSKTLDPPGGGRPTAHFAGS